jgi:hypothetical protein
MKSLIILTSFILVIYSTLFPSGLGQLAASMKPGTFAELTTNNFKNLLYTTRDSVNINYASIMVSYAESGAWDPNARKFLFQGAPHGNAWKLIIYNDGDNTWKAGPLPLDCMYLGGQAGGCGGHAYDHNTFNPLTGEFYWRYRKMGPNIFKYHVASNTWDTLPAPTGSMLTSWDSRTNKFGGMEFCPGLGGILSAAGGLVFFYNTQTRQWTKLPSQSMGSTNNFVEYNPVHKVAIFGGGKTGDAAVKAFYKIDSNLRITKMGSAPVDLTVCRSLVMADPVSGKYIVISQSNSVYEYDVTRDSWSNLGIKAPAALDVELGIGAPVSTYGVIMYVCKEGVILYKHKDCPDCPKDGPLSVSGVERLWKDDLIGVTPSPFNSIVQINYELGITNYEWRKIEIKIYDVSGKMIADLTPLIPNSSFLIRNSVSWNASHLPSGIYLLKARTGQRTLTKKLLLRK